LPPSPLTERNVLNVASKAASPEDLWLGKRPHWQTLGAVT
jgi:hypothetical protein